jgi:uncharacterized protein YfaS (alpha-2-macroglobulin family)
MSRRAANLIASFMLVLGLAMPAMAEQRQVVTTPDSDYFGFDLRTVQNVTLDQCKTTCIGDKQCRAFTYNTKAKWCFLKSDFSRINPFPGAVAGRVVSISGEPDLGAPAELSFLPDYVGKEAIRYRAELLSAEKPDETMGVGVWIAGGDMAVRTAAFPEAVDKYRSALQITPDDRTVWSKLADAILRVDTNDYSERARLQRDGTSAALNGYRQTRGRNERAATVALLARALDKRDLYRPAIESYKASLELANSAEVRAAFDDLRARKGFRVVEHTVDADSASPRVCIQFSEDLVKSGVDYAKFFTVDGAAPKGVTVSDRQVCVEGLEHGKYYDILMRDGVPSSVGENILAPVALNIYVRDRAPSIRFTGENFVLPSTARRGIPLVSVNTETADVSLYRVGDRALAQLLSGYQFLRALDGYDVSNLEEQLGEAVWKGELSIASELNKEIVTSFPVDEALKERKPGVYVLVAMPKGDQSDSWNGRATQWFVVSDIGLQTYAGQDGLTVFARSLATAKPLPGATLTLLAKNNEILGTATSDADGKATFTAGLTRGTEAMAPAALLAKNGDADFVFLDMTRAGFDLSDRGVTGRAAPGALDVFTWTERGIYRAGETVHVAALARNDGAEAVADLPLTFIFSRPDGVEDRRIVARGEALGGYALDLPLQPNAMHGTWTLEVHADPKQPAIANGRFLVEDFVPDRIEFDLSTDADEVAVGGTAEIGVDGRFLYGAPAAGLSLEGEVSISTLREWDDFPGYQFGLADEENDDSGNVTALEDLPVTDDDGKASFPVTIEAVPSTTRLLGATVTVRMKEGGGRAVERDIDIGIAPGTDMIGIRPEFSGEQVAENSQAAFRVIAVTPQGGRADMANLSWRLEKIDRHYQWYRSNNSWNYEPITVTTKVADGRIDATAASEPQITVPVTWGRYRLEVDSPDASGPATSVEFSAGWFVEATSTETPDGLEIALDKESYHAGETARLNVSPRFAGELLVTVGADRLYRNFNASVPAEGATIDIPVDAAWGAGAYVTATLFRPGDAQETRMPMRAIGLKWLKVDPGARKLDVAIEAPQKSEPRKPLIVPVIAPGTAGQKAYVTVAAVDVGILNLTRYTPPDPAGWYYGQRSLGLEIRDLYGRLIDGSLGAMGRIRTGGDGGGMAIEGSPPTEKLVAFFSGPVEMDKDGRAVVSFDIPQFNGTVRVMAVAWTKDAVGSGTADVIVRDPVVVTAGMPRFMAPGDTATLRLDIANTDGPAGQYRLSVETDGVLAVEAPAEALELAAGARRTVELPLTANHTGDGAITVRLAHAEGTEVTHFLSLPVRPSALPLTTRHVVNLAANGGKLTVDGELLAGSLLDGASISLSVTPIAAFDVPSLLLSLDRYPYGCAEQTTSRALPLLYVGELAKQAGLADDPALHDRIQDAIRRVVSYQSSSGSFGLWGPGYGDLWLDAYVSDFLTRALEQKYDVPAEAMRIALDNLQNSLGYDVDLTEKGPEIAYTLYVLARNGRASAGDLRYYADTKLGDFSTPMARAQIGASLALYGDTLRAEKAFRSALELARSSETDYYRSDYGSALRDGAAMLALAAETRPLPGLMPELVSYAAGVRTGDRYTSTQEQAWMLLAARALSQGSAAIDVEVNGEAHKGGWSQRLDGSEIEATPVSIVNRSASPVDAVVTTVAAPADPLPAGGEGYEITREYYNLDGSPADIQQARQNERFVVVLNVTEQNDWPARTLVTDPLPAGLEIDNPGLVNSADLSNFDWLPETEAAHLEFRDDRFVAALDSSGGPNTYTLAYVVRAVTPGVYVHPAAQVEDMYRPEFSARTAAGMMEVEAAK